MVSIFAKLFRDFMLEVKKLFFFDRFNLAELTIYRLYLRFYVIYLSA